MCGRLGHLRLGSRLQSTRQMALGFLRHHQTCTEDSAHNIQRFLVRRQPILKMTMTSPPTMLIWDARTEV